MYRKPKPKQKKLIVDAYFEIESAQNKKKVKSLPLLKGLLHFEYGNVTQTIREMTKILLQF